DGIFLTGRGVQLLCRGTSLSKPAAATAIGLCVSAGPQNDVPPRTSLAPPQTIALPQQERAGRGALKPLNFKISADFRRSFKTYAARHDLTARAVLRRVSRSAGRLAHV
ncbi:MAG TPA: hypothetical protein VN901_23495, partial [Candidatus Acidoferrales bacterium]|nr:hypothetical protein [Candidatus Acidoferrales bacterium]